MAEKIKGWLLFYVIISCLYLVCSVSFPLVWAFNDSMIVIAYVFTYFSVTSFSIASGSMLITLASFTYVFVLFKALNSLIKRQKNAIKKNTSQLIFLGVLMTSPLILKLVLLGIESSRGGTFYSVTELAIYSALTLTWCFIWALYFKKSKYVNALLIK